MDPDRRRHLFDLVAEDPEVELTVNLDAQRIHLPGDEDLEFDIDPFVKLMILPGTDELGLPALEAARDRPLGGGPPGPGRHPNRDSPR